MKEENKRAFLQPEEELKFKRLLKSLVTDYYKHIVEREKDICSFGVFTDSDISGFVLRFNTKAGMEAIIRSGISYSKKYPDDKTEIDSGKWWMPEWASESADDTQFYHRDDRYEQIDQLLTKLIGRSVWDLDEEKNTFAIYKKELFDSICDVLKELQDENLFEGTPEDFYLLVQELDNGIYDGREKSLRKIMSKEQFKEYEK